MSGIELGENTKGVSINGVDIQRVGMMIIDGNASQPDATDNEKRIAAHVALKVAQMRSKGYLTQDCAKQAKRLVVDAAQKLPTKVNGSSDEDTPAERPAAKPMPRPVHRGEPS